jgi:hypothetical protein
MARWLSVAWSFVKGRFAREGRRLVRCREQCNEQRERKRRGAVIKSGAWFSMRSIYWGGGERERGDKRLWGMWSVTTYNSKFTFSSTDNAQYFILFKLDTRRYEKPILTCHYILLPQPRQPKSCTCFYAYYVSFLGQNIAIYIYIFSPKKLTYHKRVLLKATKETGPKLHMDIVKHMLHELDTKLKSPSINLKCFKIYVYEHFLSSHTSHITGN